jgi:methionine-rich copper-binding protein CopC
MSTLNTIITRNEPMNRKMKNWALGLAVFPVLAAAHAHLDSAMPANGSTVQAAPSQAMLMFSEPVALNEVTLEKVGGKAEALKNLPKDFGRHQMVNLPKLGDGRYVLRYRGVSEDTHESKGSVSFTVSAKGTEKPVPAPPEGHGQQHKD